MKKKLWAFVASVYLVMACMLVALWQIDLPVTEDFVLPSVFYVLLGLVLLSVLLAIINIRTATKESKALTAADSLNDTLKTVALAKYALLVFFIVQMVFWARFFFTVINPLMGPLILVLAISPLCLAYNLLLLAGTSLYSGLAIWQLQEGELLGSKQHFRYLVCQVFFVADVIAIALLLRKLKRAEKALKGERSPD